MSATAYTERAVSALAELAYAYFDRIAAGDTARANIVLGEFARVFVEFHDDVLANATGRGVTASTIPATITASWSTSTRLMLVLALFLGWGDRVRAAANTTPGVLSGVAAWFPQLRAGVGAPPTIVSTIVGASPADLTRNLSGMVNEQIYGISIGMPTPVPATPVPAPAPPLPVPVTPGPEIDIYGNTGRWTMPTWGWWAVGLGLAAAVGYTGYRVWKRA